MERRITVSAALFTQLQQLILAFICSDSGPIDPTNRSLTDVTAMTGMQRLLFALLSQNFGENAASSHACHMIGLASSVYFSILSS